MATELDVPDLINAKLDTDHLAALTSVDGIDQDTATDRKGQVKPTWTGIAKTLNAEYAITAVGALKTEYEDRVYPGVYSTPPTNKPHSGAPCAQGDRCTILSGGVAYENIFTGGGWLIPNVDATQLALSTGALRVGTPEGTVQVALNARTKAADFASGAGVRASGFLGSGSRASLVDLQAKLMESISVESYGIKPSDSVTKTTDGFQRVLADLQDAGGGQLRMESVGQYKLQAGELAISGVPFSLCGKSMGMTSMLGVGGTGNILTITQTDFTNATYLRDFSVLTQFQETQSGISIIGSPVDSQINRVQARCDVASVEFRGVDVSAHGFSRGLILSNTHNLGLTKVFAAGRRSDNSRAGSTYMIAGIDIIGGVTSIPSDILINTCRTYHAQNGFRATGGVEGLNYVQCIAVAVDVGYLSDNTGAGNRPWVSIDDSHSAAYLYCVKLINSPQSFVTNSVFYKREESNADTVAISLTDSDLCKVSGNLGYNASSGYVDHGDYVGVEIGGSSSQCTVDQNTFDRVKYGVSLLGSVQNTTVRDNHANLQGSGTPKEYNNQSTGSGNRRIDNPQFETSARFSDADMVFGSSLIGAVAIAIDTAELGDEYIVTATIRVLKDATPGGIKATIGKTSGTATPVFENTDGQAYGYAYLGGSKDGYITIATAMKVSVPGSLVLVLSVATDAGQATLQTNNAQISISRK